MTVKILRDGPESAELEDAVRSALGERPEGECWVISLVRHRSLWSASVLVSPHDRLWGWSWLGGTQDIPAALAEALRAAGLDARPRVPAA